MEKIYTFLSRHQWLVWAFIIVTTLGLGAAAVQCRLEENIFKLLPQSTNETARLAFSDLRLKDKIFVQVGISDPTLADSLEIDATYMAEAMDFFINAVQEKDSDLQGVYNTLSEVDPLMFLEAADYIVNHGPSYLDLTTEELDSLCSEEHISKQIAFYMDLLETDLGSNLYDVISYDPCGLALAKIKDKSVLSSFMNEETRSNRFQENHLFSTDGTTCMGFITPTFGPENSAKSYQLIRLMNEAKAETMAEYPGIEVLYHGTIVLAAYNSYQIKKDLFLTLGLALSFIVVLLLICFKRPSYILLMLFPIVFGVLLSLGCIELGRGWMSLMALGLGAIVLGVALSYCLHVLIHYVYTGDVKRTLREQSKPVLMGALTTIGAFAGLLFTKSSLLQDFGIFALLVIVGTTFISLFIMPQFFPKKNEPNKRAFALMERFNCYEIDRNRFVCAVVWIFVAVCICFSNRYEFDSNLYHIGYVTEDTQRAQDNWNRLMNDGSTQQYYASVAPTLEEALEQLPHMEDVVDSLRRQGIVLNKVEVSTFAPSLKVQEERNELWLNYFTAEKQDEIWSNIRSACRKQDIDESMFEPFLESMSITAEPAHICEALNMSDEPLIPEEILGNFIEHLDNGMVLVYFPVKTAKENTTAVKDILTKVPGCMVLDPYYYSTDLVELIHSDFNLIMMISSIFVFLLLLVAYHGNIWVALIAFSPMILSWYTVLGAMALFDQPFNVINIVVSSFIFGIGVDYSIFIMDGLMKGERAGKTMMYHKTAITMSAFVLVVCMFSLVFATHPAINSIGFVSLVGMITTMMLSYTLQPNLYRLYMKVKQAQHKH